MIARRLRLLIAAVGALVLGCGVAEASPITVSFAFQATDFLVGDPHGTAPPVDPVSGNISFTFEEPILCGGAGCIAFPPDAMNMTIAGFRYDVTNTLVQVDNFDFFIFGELNGAILSSSTNDFSLVISRTNSGPGTRGFLYTVPFSNDSYFTNTVSVTPSPAPEVPESGSLILLALGGCVWLGADRLCSRLAARRV